MIETTKPDQGFHAMGTDFEHKVHEVQNEIRANHEMPPLTFRERHEDYFSWFNAVGKVLWRKEHEAI